MTNKPGHRTTEFAAMALFAVGTLASSIADKLSPKWAAISISVATAAYAISRGLAKVTINYGPTPPPPPTP